MPFNVVGQPSEYITFTKIILLEGKQYIVGFVQKLADLLEDYDIACEHEHSNCVLIAHKKVG